MPLRNVLSRMFPQSPFLVALLALAVLAGPAHGQSSETGFSVLALFFAPEAASASLPQAALVTHDSGHCAHPEAIDLTVQTDDLWLRIRNGFFHAQPRR